MLNKGRVKVTSCEFENCFDDVGVAPRAKVSGTTSDKNDNDEGLITVA